MNMQLVSSSLFQIKTVAVDPKLPLFFSTSSRQSFIVIIDERVQPEDAARSFPRKDAFLNENGPAGPSWKRPGQGENFPKHLFAS